MWYINPSLLKVWVHRRFLDKMQQMSTESWVKAFCSICGICGLSKNASVEGNTSISVESAGSQKIPWQIATNVYGKLGESFLFNLCGKCGLSEDSFMKCKQISMQNWVKDFCSISVETASSREKKCLGGKWCFYVSLWKVQVLRRFLDKKCNKLLREVGWELSV